MLTLTGPRISRFCDKVTRRSFLQVGGLFMGGLTLPRLLQAEHSSSGNQPSTSRQRSAIMIYMPGGPPHQDMYDLKPDAPAEVRGEFDPIATSVPGIEICELMPRLAQRMDKFAIIRSLVGSDGAHASNLCVTGAPYGNKIPGGAPHFGSMISALQGQTHRAVPAVADLSDMMQHLPYNVGGPGFLGSVHQPFRPDGDTRANMVLNESLAPRMDDRRMLLTSFDRFRHEADAHRHIGGMETHVDQALDVLTSSRVMQALDLDREDPKVRERYGADDLQILPYSNLGYRALVSRFLMARRLVEAGVRCVTVSFADFDWHGSNFAFGRKVFPVFDQAITALVDDLHERGMADDVSVVAWGEFGRTPRINATAGRDHWPQVSCALLAGGGMKTGQVIGSTNRLAESAQSRPVHYCEVLATLYHNLGVDVETATVRDPGGRPRYLIDGHRPIPELVG
ncbi:MULTISPECIES: DUF1501 domain-containing protein [unclassified Schlesneria]|uniref:DUF1501 domain-containing protein n=1 Tax=Schlesneria TaxID=656899 RepID=UPI0035A10251